MKIARHSKKQVVRQGEAAILFAVGEFTFAAPAKDVDEIRDLHGLRWVKDATASTSVAKVQAELVRAGKTYLVVNASRQFRLAESNAARLMVLREQPVAVLVDSIDRMTEIREVLPLPKAFRGEERRWYQGLALVNDAVIPVVKMAGFLSAAEQVIARSLVERLARGVSV